MRPGTTNSPHANTVAYMHTLPASEPKSVMSVEEEYPPDAFAKRFRTLIFQGIFQNCKVPQPSYILKEILE